MIRGHCDRCSGATTYGTLLCVECGRVRNELFNKLAMYVYGDCQPCDELDNPKNPRSCNDCQTCEANALYDELKESGWTPSEEYPDNLAHRRARDELFEELIKRLRHMQRWECDTRCYYPRESDEKVHLIICTELTAILAKIDALEGEG